MNTRRFKLTQTSSSPKAGRFQRTWAFHSAAEAIAMAHSLFTPFVGLPDVAPCDVLRVTETATGYVLYECHVGHRGVGA